MKRRVFSVRQQPIDEPGRGSEIRGEISVRSRLTESSGELDMMLARPDMHIGFW